MAEPIIDGIIPLFAIIIAGFLATRFKILGMNSAHVLQRFVFYFALPPLLFRSLATSQFKAIINIPFIIAFTSGMLIIFAIMYLISYLFLPPNHLFNPMRACAASFPNSGYIGIPFLYIVFGQKGLVPAAFGNLLTMIPIIVTLFLLDLETTKSESRWLSVTGAVRKTLINPAVFSPIIGILYSATTLPLPKMVDTFCLQLGNAAVPCALFAIGLNLKVGNFFARPLAYAVIMSLKLLVAPILTLGLMLALHVDPQWAIAGFLLSAMPCGVLTSIIAERYGVFELQSGSLIFLTTFLSILTLSIALLIIPIFWPGVM